MSKTKIRVLFILGYCLVLSALCGCSVLGRITKPGRSAGSIKAMQQASYSGLKATVAVADFEVKAVKASSEVGLNLREMLVEALLGSNRYLIVESKPGAAGADEKTATGENDAVEQKDEVRAADLIITVAVTDFEPQISGGRAGLGGGGGVGSGILGGLLGQALKKAYLVLEIRIADAATSSVLATSRIQGQASDIAGEKRTDDFSRINLVGGLSSYNNTPIEKAIRMCIVETVRYLTTSVPTNYYKY